MARKNIGLDKPWSNKYTILSAFVILLSLIVYIIFDSFYQVTPEGMFTKPQCYDTDFGKTLTKKGAVVILDEHVENLVKVDECSDNGLIEYYCTWGNYSSELVDCLCKDGKCIS